MIFKKKDFVEILYNVLIEENLTLSKSNAKIILDKFLANFEDAIIANPDGIRLGKSGTFKIITRNERIGVNPKTQRPIIIPATHALIFRQSASIKKRLRK